MKFREKIYIPFALQISAISVALICLTAGLFFLQSYRIAADNLEGRLAKELLAVVNTSAPLIDMDAHESISVLEEETGEDFNLVREQLVKIRDWNNLAHGHGSPVYTLRPTADFDQSNKLEFVVMTDKNNANEYFIGARLDAEPFHRKVLKGKTETTGIYEDSEGTWITAAAPLISDGNVVGILQADRTVNFFAAELALVRQQYLLSAFLCICVGVVLSLLFALNTKRPVATLQKATHAFGRGDYSYRISNRRVDEFDELFLQFNIMAAKVEKTINYEVKKRLLIESLNQKLEWISSRDELTNLHNRTSLNERMHLLAENFQRTGDPFAIMLLDLDRFKEINDSFGHRAGDQVLEEFSLRLLGAFRVSDLVARLGGDEFVILLPSVQLEELPDLCKKIVELMNEPFVFLEQRLYLGVSIGVAFSPLHSVDAFELMRLADIAMYSAKKQNLPFMVYSNDLESNVRSEVELRSDLKNAVARDQFQLLYQIKVDLKTQRITGVEALIRWLHPELGLIQPEDFIYLAESSKHIDDLTMWVIDQACRDGIRWHRAGYPLNVAVNLSPVSLNNNQFATDLIDILKSRDFPPSLFEVELTENRLMSEQSASQLLNVLKKNDISITIDDFGTGYSSLSYLRKLPIRTIKIDKSFVLDLSIDSDNASIVKATIEMAHNLDMKVIAEGVESKESAELVCEWGCDEGQGFYFNRPASIDEVDKLLELYNKNSPRSPNPNRLAS